MPEQDHQPARIKERAFAQVGDQRRGELGLEQPLVQQSRGSDVDLADGDDGHISKGSVSTAKGGSRVLMIVSPMTMSGLVPLGPSLRLLVHPVSQQDPFGETTRVPPSLDATPG